MEPALSARLPKFSKKGDGYKLELEIQNFGQVASRTSKVKIEYVVHSERIEVASGQVSKLKPFEKTKVKMKCGNVFVSGVDYDIVVSIFSDQQKPVTLHGKVSF